MKFSTTLEELWRSDVYRRHPAAAMRYVTAKWMFRRHRVSSPDDFLRRHGLDPDVALDGFERWAPLLESVVDAVSSATGQQGGVSSGDGRVLFGCVRALKPRRVIETGIAAGVSTAFVIAALLENGVGELVSIELPDDDAAHTRRHSDGSKFDWPARGAGWAVPPDLRDRIGDRHSFVFEDVRTALPRLLPELAPIDMFIHDDLHTPSHMLWEYSLVWPFLAPGGAVISDDVNWGWVEFARRHGGEQGGLANLDRLALLRKES